MRRLGLLIGRTISSSNAWPEEALGATGDGESVKDCRQHGCSRHLTIVN
jgi:hypothetical protein